MNYGWKIGESFVYRVYNNFKFLLSIKYQRFTNKNSLIIEQYHGHYRGKGWNKESDWRDH